MTEKQERLRETLDGLTGQGGILGAVLVSRDGFCILNRLESLPRPETFAAMSATLLGAAEAALLQAGAGDPARVIVTTDAGSLIATGVSDEAVLVVMTNDSAALDEATKACDSAVAAVNKAMSG